ncbi:MAG: tetratricopeptide repeat protein [Congregibacter sp.]
MISERATEIFLKATTLDLEGQKEFLRNACAQNESLRNEVESLLVAANDADAYFDTLASKVSLSALAFCDDEQVAANTLIGPWRLQQRIGRGGMGAVYLAERADGQYEQKAALKILPIGLDSEHGRARFLIERQILARLVHDNIARLIDGGVTQDGLPYFVMDYVDGQLIDDYCTSRKLGINERLALVLDVAGAVQYAHRNLIIHRDLKPGNVLVNPNGQVRLLDFGIAKILHSESLSDDLTREAQRPSTPAFASPEMLRGEPVDVTTDIYSIGALMYVLLTGKLPLEFEGLSLSELYKMSSETMPMPMADVNADLAGDLEAIVGKALAKLPEERYDSVQSLADDIRNYLAGLPVAAKAPSPLYRSIKFVRRHRVGVAVSIFAFAALTTIAVLASRSAVLADRQSRQIALERDRAEQTKDFLISIFESADPNVTPGQLTAREILELGRARITNELAEQPEVQADLLRSMSKVYQNWRMVSEGRSALEQELALRAAVSGVGSPEYAQTLIGLAFINEIGGDYDNSIRQARRALGISETIGDRMGQAVAAERIGRVLHLRGDLDGAQTHFERAMRLFVENAGSDAIEVAQVSEHLANLYSHRQEYEKALEGFARSLAIQRRHIPGDSSIISSIYLGMGSALNQLNRYDEAAEVYLSGLRMNERLFGAENSYALYFINGLGKIAQNRGDLERALSRYIEAQRLTLKYMPESPNLAFATANIGKVHRLRGQYRTALPFLRAALKIFDTKLPEHWARGDVMWQLGLCLVETGRYEEAEPLILAGIESVENHWGPAHETTTNAREAAVKLYTALGQFERALAYQDAGIKHTSVPNF